MDKFIKRNHQTIVKKWFDGRHTKLLLFHGIGSGKTCTSILTMKSLFKQRKIDKVYCVTSASLLNSFKTELLSNCGKYKIIPDNVHILSYQSFFKLSKLKINNSLIIIDEIQNIVNDSGKYYKWTKQKLNNNSIHVILMSATPIMNDPYEIALTLNLLSPNLFPQRKLFYDQYINNDNIKNKDLFIKKIYKHVSYFTDQNKTNYPKRIDIIEYCKMSDYQFNIYKKSFEKNINKKSFFINQRLVSNLAFPHDNNTINKKDLRKYSAKFHKCIQNIQQTNKKSFIYSNFVKKCGIIHFSICLKTYGYIDYKDDTISDKKFGIFYANKPNENRELLEVFNSKENKSGNLCKLILGSPAMSEGVTLLRCGEIHLLDPAWNHNSNEQIIGRGIRYKSHANLNKDKQNVICFNISVLFILKIY